MKITNTSDVKSHNVYALVVGRSGVGKTSLAKTLPEDKVLILSAESGLLSLHGTSIDVVKIETFQDLIDAYSFLNSNQSKYEHIIIDSLTELGEKLLAELKPNYKKAQNFQLYADYSEKMTKMLKAFRDLHQYNIYMLALDKLTPKDFTEVVSIDLVQKSLSKKLPALFDEVFYYVKEKREDGSVVRALCTDSDDVDFTKDRSGIHRSFVSRFRGRCLS
jgi:phage nucleotide-binding protein